MEKMVKDAVGRITALEEEIESGVLADRIDALEDVAANGEIASGALADRMDAIEEEVSGVDQLVRDAVKEAIDGMPLVSNYELE